MIGGYSLLDFENKNISSEPVLIEGLYQKFLTSNKKTFLLCNILLNGEQYNNVFSSPYYDSGTLVFPCFDGYIKVSESDHVSYGITADDIADKYLSKEEFLTVIRRTRRDITNDLAYLSRAVEEQNLEKYGYSIGDYFIGASGYTYFLADMNTFRGAQSDYAVINQNHISIVVKTGANSKWNETNDTSTGYSGSVLHTYLSGTVLDNIKSDMIALFGGSTGLEHLLSHQLMWTTATSSWSWSGTAQYISALTEPQVYGTNVWAIDGYQTGEAWKWLELFKKFSYMEILGWIWFWLRSIRSASHVCDAGKSDYADNSGASNGYGVVGLIIFK